MSHYEVSVEAKVQVFAENFQQAADVAQGVIAGTKGKPDTLKIVNVSASSVLAL